jgi:hypothetical protein
MTFSSLQLCKIVHADNSLGRNYQIQRLSSETCRSATRVFDSAIVLRAACAVSFQRIKCVCQARRVATPHSLTPVRINRDDFEPRPFQVYSRFVCFYIVLRQFETSIIWKWSVTIWLQFKHCKNGGRQCGFEQNGKNFLERQDSI